MPIVQKLMTSLKARYGDYEGERIYYAMEAEGTGPFGKGKKHHDLHLAFLERNGVRPLDTKKPRSSKRKAGAKKRR